MANSRAATELRWWELALLESVGPEELAKVKEADWAAIKSGARLAFVPVFYAFVRV